MSELNTGERTESMGQALIARSGELAISAAAARAKAEAEAGYQVALRNPRNIHQARIEILEACRRPRFAEAARYRKSVGKTAIVGPSIRFAEVAIQAMGNVSCAATITYEDEQIRCLNIRVTDYEKNIVYGEDVTLTKTVERSSKAGREVVGERLNTKGEKVYVVMATEDEMKNKANAAKSIAIRSNGLRLVPQDIVEEAMDQCIATIAGESGQDPVAYRNKWIDAFKRIGVSVKDLEIYLAHTIDLTTPDEWADLSAVHAAIKNKESKWSDYIDPRRPERGTLNPEDLKPVEPPIDVTPEAVQTTTAMDIWNQWLLDMKKKGLVAEGQKYAKSAMLAEYGLNDPKELANADIDTSTFQLYLVRLENELASEDYLK